jgi:hypothetical protein
VAGFVGAIKPLGLLTDADVMHGSPFSQASGPGDPFGTQSSPRRPFGRLRRPARGVWLIVTIVCVLARVLLIVDGPSTGGVLLDVVAGHPSCVAAGIDSAGGREGTCVEGPLGSLTTVHVVDRARRLGMPEYDVRLLGSQVAPTRVSNAAKNEDLYPDGAGQLVSYELSVTNTGEGPLRFGVGTGYQRPASYSPDPVVELALPESLRSASDLVVTYPPIIEGHHAPTHSILQQPPIAPHETRTGWVSFIASAWALSVLHKPGADIDFYKVDGDQHYRGSIRLWK